MLHFCFFGVVCRLLFFWLSEIYTTNSCHTSVCQKRIGIGKKMLENGCTLVVVDLSFSQ